jgi:putative membrane protein
MLERNHRPISRGLGRHAADDSGSAAADDAEYVAARQKLSDTISEVMAPRRSSNMTCMKGEGLKSMGVVDEKFDSVAAVDAMDDIVYDLLYGAKYKGCEMIARRNPGWCETLLTTTGRATLGPVYYFMVAWSVCVVAFFRYHVGVTPDVVMEPWIDMEAIPLLLISVGLMFLVVFRTQTTYRKWNQARAAWTAVNGSCRALALQACVYLRDLDAASSVCRYLVVFVLSVRFWLREEPLPEDLVGTTGLLTPDGLAYLSERAKATELQTRVEGDADQSFHFKNTTAPIPVLDVLRGIVKHAHEKKQVGPFHSMMEGHFKLLQQNLHAMEKVLDTQIPYAYITHVRTAIFVYCTSIPFFLVKDYGWYTVLFVMFYCYVVIGLENLAVEIENPFGTDANDLPMDVYCCQITRDICDTVKRRQAYTAEAGDTYEERHGGDNDVEEDEDDDDDDDDGDDGD